MAKAQTVSGDGRPLLLKGDRVGLALMRRDDVAAIAEWHQNLGFTANMGNPGEAQSLEAREEFFDQNARMRPDSAEFAVILISTSELIGFGGLFDVTRGLTATMFAGIGQRAHQSKGYGTEACRLICEYGFFFRSLHSIKVEVNGYNRRAIRVYERLGFKPAGRLRGVILLNGKRYDQVIMDLLRDEFPLMHASQFEGLEREQD
jgi:RimJ/RimL family protein N-acetyltransferase